MLSALPPAPFLYAIIDSAFLAGRSVGELVSGLASGGAGLLQLRAKRESDARFLELAREAVAAARAARVPLVVNDRPDVARAVGADGVHVGQGDLPPATVRALLPRGSLIGVSTHDSIQLHAAVRMPVDYVAVGPVFPTRTHERPSPVVGLSFVAEARAATRMPLVAIGGITAENAASVIHAGADGIAVISAILEATDVEGPTRALALAMRAS